MAHLPPKVPNMGPNWHIPRVEIPSMENFPPNTSNKPTMFDEFLDFSLLKCGAHRRSVSDSIAFLEFPPGTKNGETEEFDRLDDQQFMSMFTDEILTRIDPTISSPNPSTSSDHNSTSDDQQQIKMDSNEVESTWKSESQAPPRRSSDRTVDSKRVKRVLANRQSAQRSRVRKLQYISELERSVTSLQTEVSVLSPCVAYLDHQRLILNVDNSTLKQRIAALAQDEIFKDAHQQALKGEIERLRHVYHQQNQKKIGTNSYSTAEPTVPTDGNKRPMDRV